MKNSIIKISLFMLTLISVLSSCKTQCVDRHFREVQQKNFNQIEANGNFLVTVMKGDSFTVTIDGCEEDVLDVKSVKEANKLRFEFNTPTRQHSVVAVKITLPKITAFEISGTSSIRFVGWDSIKQLNGDVSGVSRADLSAHIDKLLLSVSGQSSARVIGTITQLKSSVSGQSELDTYGLSANQKSEIAISGQSEAKIFCKQELKADVSGQSTLRYKGNPTIKAISVTGQSKVLAE